MLVWILRCLRGIENKLYLIIGFKIKVCLGEKKPEITSWVTCDRSPLLVYSVVKRRFFTSPLTELIVLVLISVSNKQNKSIPTFVSLRDYTSHLNLVYRCYVKIISNAGSRISSGNERSNILQEWC